LNKKWQFLTAQFNFEFRASEIMKTDGIRKQAINNYFYGFVQRDISKQGCDIKASHGKIIGIKV
jgi:hypothetical protein